MSFLKKLKNFFGFENPLKITPEREDELLEKIAGLVLRFGLDSAVLPFGDAIIPMSSILAITTLLPASFFLEGLGIPGFELTAFFEKRENVERLLKRIDELQREKETKG